MKKFRQIAAILGIVLLVLMYVMTVVFALIDDSRTMNLLVGSIACTIVIPVFLWVLGIFLRIGQNNSSSSTDSPDSDSEDQKK